MIKQSYTLSNTWEGQFIEVMGENLTKNIIIGNIYRPPRNAINNYRTFIDELTPILEFYNRRKCEIVLAGDFNINLLKVNERDIFDEFLDTMVSNGFFPKITLPTRFSNRNGTLIDNFFCKISKSTLSAISGILIKKFSDHQPYFTFINTLKDTHLPPKFVTLNKHTPAAIATFYHEIQNANILDKIDRDPLSNPDTNYNVIEQIIDTARNKHLPVRTIRFNKYKHKKNMWITNGILRSIRYRDNLYKQLKTMHPESTAHHNLKVNLQTYNRILKQNIREAKLKYYESCFSKYKTDMKNTWSTINTIIQNKKKTVSLPEYFKEDNKIITDKLTIANKFNLFFTNIGPKLARKIDTPGNINHTLYLRGQKTHSLKFRTITEATLGKIIDNLPSKNSSGYDMISLKLLKILKAPLLSPLTIIINQMLNTGIFPNNLKVAKIIPIYKKDDQFIFDNYRPISLLPVMSKLFEKVIFKQLYTFFQDNKLFYESQYGFRTGHSTELVALEIVDKIISEMDNGEVPINIFLDLSKAFDTLDHEILLHKLNYYGVKGIPYNLIKNYLTDRKQFVDIDGIKSDSLPISTGVPQGSVLGPLLFIIYINDLSLVSTIFKPIIYADDTTLFSTLKSFYSNTDTNIDLHINKELDKVDTWLKANKLSLNVKKTKLMIFHMPSKKIKLPKIEIMKAQIECVDQFNFLGITPS